MKQYKILTSKKIFQFFIFTLFCNINVFSQCNGEEDSCNKKYNEVAYLTTHNAFNSGQDGFNLPNQNNNIATQLNDGVRGLMIDIYNDNGTTVVYHGLSFLGKKPLSIYLSDIKTFLDNNPTEIVTIIFQNAPEVTANKIESDFTKAGLMNYLHTQNKFSAWPTLQTMINANKRLVIFNEVNNATSGQGWYHHIFDFAVENNYGQINCDYGRGNSSNGLFIFNHFVTSGTGTASTAQAQTVNSNPYFIDHITSCQQEKNKFPNFVTVDFYDIGNAMDVVNQLNASNPGSGGSGGGSGNNENPPGNGSDNKDPKILQLRNGGKLTVNPSASLNLKGLKLTPSFNAHVFVNNNTITRSLEAIGSDPNLSMARVFNFETAINNFTGEVTYYYDDVDLGTITHDNAVLQVKNDANLWSNFADEDTNTDNQIVHTFNSSIKFKSLTASASTTTLSVNYLAANLEISMFPNPVSSILNINYDGNLSTIVFDFLGRSVIKTTSKEINMSNLPNGLYIIQTKDILSNKTKSYKVVKK